MTAHREVPLAIDRIGRVRDQLSRIGVELRVDTEDDAAGAAWPDFRDLDAVLCMPHDSTLQDERRKPPTKLINSWVAGVIPVCSPLPGYAELANPNQDSVFVTDPDDIVPIISRLNADPATVARLLANSAVRGDEFRAERLVPRWFAALEAAPPIPQYRVFLDALIALAQSRVGVGVAKRLQAAVDRWDVRDRQPPLQQGLTGAPN